MQRAFSRRHDVPDRSDYRNKRDVTCGSSSTGWARRRLSTCRSPEGNEIMPESVESPNSSRRRILIVEDEVLIGMLLEDMLGDLGYDIAASASRVEEAKN